MKFVLRLLVRLRCVILHDAANYLYLKSIYHYGSPLLEKLPDVFGSNVFDEFQKDVAAALSKQDPELPADLPPNIMLALQAWQTHSSNILSDLNKNYINTTWKGRWQTRMIDLHYRTGTYRVYNMISASSTLFSKRQASCVLLRYNRVDNLLLPRHNRSLAFPIIQCSFSPSDINSFRLREGINIMTEHKVPGLSDLRGPPQCRRWQQLRSQVHMKIALH
ncbi:hypothetical protein BGW39_010069 [Mortierella sp. 14UC]|nr:hypothetical protein BGW39_010069 [Mortierella sp. 14UC]